MGESDPSIGPYRQSPQSTVGVKIESDEFQSLSDLRSTPVCTGLKEAQSDLFCIMIDNMLLFATVEALADAIEVRT